MCLKPRTNDTTSMSVRAYLRWQGDALQTRLELALNHVVHERPDNGAERFAELLTSDIPPMVAACSMPTRGEAQAYLSAQGLKALINASLQTAVDERAPDGLLRISELCAMAARAKGLPSFLLPATAKTTLSSLDDRLIKALKAGDIRLLRASASWLTSLPVGTRISRLQDLEAIERDHGVSIFLSPSEAVAAVKRADRSVAVLSYAWLSPMDCDPCGSRLEVVRRALLENDHITALFWECAIHPLLLHISPTRIHTM